MTGTSPLELLHPDGSVRTSLVLGSNCPDELLPEPQPDSEQEIELIVLAPSKPECRSKGWLDRAAERVKGRLSDDGLCYLMAPWPWRTRMIRSLARSNLDLQITFWHFPDYASSRCIVPLRRGPALFAIENVIRGPAWKRAVASGILRRTAARGIFGALWGSTGAVLRRPGARPLFQWVFRAEPPGFFPGGSAVVRKTWRGFCDGAVLYLFQEAEEQPSAVVKVKSSGGSRTRPESEAEILETLGPCIEAAGARAPKVIRTERSDRRASLFLTHLPGRSAAELLASDPDLLAPLMGKLAEWLGCWHRATVHVRPPGEEALEGFILAPLERLSPSLQHADGYRSWLSARIRAAAGGPVPRVAAHNDLTMANVLIDDQGRLGIVDWETGAARGWPLADFYYAAADAVRIARGKAGWPEAFEDCYLPPGRFTPLIRSLAAQLAAEAALPAPCAELAFHGCWLHHAANESRVSPPGVPRPFLEIVRRLAGEHPDANGNPKPRIQEINRS